MNSKYDNFMKFVEHAFYKEYGVSIVYPEYHDYSSFHQETAMRLGVESTILGVSDNQEDILKLSHLEYLNKYSIIKNLSGLFKCYNSQTGDIVQDLEEKYSLYDGFNFKMDVDEQGSLKFVNTFGDSEETFKPVKISKVPMTAKEIYSEYIELLGKCLANDKYKKNTSGIYVDRKTLKLMKLRLNMEQ